MPVARIVRRRRRTPLGGGVAKTEEALRKFGKTGHAFFAVARPQYRVHTAVDGWKKIFAWFEKHLQ